MSLLNMHIKHKKGKWEKHFILFFYLFIFFKKVSFNHLWHLWFKQALLPPVDNSQRNFGPLFLSELHILKMPGVNSSLEVIPQQLSSD